MYRNHVSIICLFLFACLSAQCQLKRPDGQTASFDDVNHIVTDLMNKGEVTGLCLGIVNDNKPAYIQTFGYKNKPLNEKLDTATCFYAASFGQIIVCIPGDAIGGQGRNRSR